MGVLTVRNVPDDIHRALRVREAEHGRSAEAEVRAILASVLKPQERVRAGDALAAIGRDLGLTREDFEFMERLRDRTPAQPMSFDE